MISEIQRLLQTDSRVAPLFATYQFGTETLPAVFTTDPAPAGCPAPLAVITLDGGTDDGTRGKRGGQMSAMVTIWGDKDWTDAPLRAIAFAAWRVLSRAAILSTHGLTFNRLAATSPVKTTDGDGFPGYRISISALFEEV